MEFIRKKQIMRWETAFMLCLLILLGLGGCGSSGPDFNDVEIGKIPLQPIETEAVKRLLEGAGIPPNKLPVYVEQTGYYKAFVNQKILVENGHVIALSLSWADLEHMDAVSAFSQLRILNLCKNQISEIRGLLEAQKLEELMLMQNKIKDPTGLEGCISLKKLELSGNELTQVPDISNMPNLERLGLALNRIRSLKGFKGGEKLKHLNLAINKLTSLVGLPNLPNLISLELEHNQLTTLEGLGELPRLRFVRLSRNQLESVDPLAACPALSSVDLSDNKIKALPRFRHEIAQLLIQGNPVEKVLAEVPKKPQPKLVYPADAARVGVLPAIDGSLYGGGPSYSRIDKNSTFVMATPSSFRFERGGLNLSGVAGFNFIPGLLSIKSVRVIIFVEKGRVRIYLKHPGDFKYVKKSYGKEQLAIIPNKDFIYADASPGQPCALHGLILRPKYCRYEVVLEAIDDSASGVSYVITNY